MTDPARIEAAARELVTDWATIDAPTEQQRQYAHKRAGEILAAAFPELASGTHWIAPMEPNEAMYAASRHTLSHFDGDYGEVNVYFDERQADALYAAMRDAYLKAQGSDA